jgi:hypothetical protein
MFLRRLSQRLKEQSWIAVVLDFLIVVSGIFIGLQVTNYSTELKEKALLKEKLTVLLIETQEIITETKTLPTVLKKLIIDSDKLLKIVNSCKNSDEINILLTSLASYSSMGDSVRLNIDDLEQHSPLLSNAFRKQLRSYKSSIGTIINHSNANTQLMSDLHLLKSPYIGMGRSDFTLTLNQPIEEVCTKPDFFKYILLPKAMAETELGLVNESQKINNAFQKSIQSEIEILN